MKNKIIHSIIILLATLMTAEAALPEHPRLFLDTKDFKALKKGAAKGLASYELVKLHDLMMKNADESCEADSLSFAPFQGKGSGLATIRNGLKRISSTAYAYKITGQDKYLQSSLRDIHTILEKFDWWTSERLYTIVASEAAMALTIAYDWLFSDINATTLADIEDFLDRHIIRNDNDARLVAHSNTAIVNSTALICSSIATYEQNTVLKQEKIDKGIKCIREVMNILYSPDGIFPESPSYADYSNMYAALSFIALEDNFGTDFSLPKEIGFKECGNFYTFVVGNTGNFFNYGDCNPKVHASTAIWYYAWKFNMPEILYGYRKMLDKGRYASNRLLLLAVTMARRMKTLSIQPPTGRLFYGDGVTPLVLARTGWDRNDHYLGIKGGCPDDVGGHGHFDAGTFIYEAYGERWITEMDHDKYDIYRPMPDSISLGFPINNRQHNTLTVNGKTHSKTGKATLLKAFDSKGRLGGSFDLTPVFSGDLKKAERTAAIIWENHLEVIDFLETGDTPARIRWTFLTKAAVSMTDDGFLLQKNGRTLKLTTDAPGAEYKTWSSNPADYDTPFGKDEKKFNGTICGFEITLAANSSLTITTTLK